MHLRFIFQLCILLTFMKLDICIDLEVRRCNDTPKGVYLPILKLHSILAVANLLAHNNF